MFRAILAAAFTLAIVPVASAAEAVVIDRPAAGASLNEGPIDMSLYYVAEGDRLDVVATFVADAAPDTAKRFHVLLEDNAVVMRKIEEAPDDVYEFRRDGDIVSVTIHPDSVRFAAN